MTFARIGIFEADGEPLEPIVELFRDRITPLFEAIDGFLGYQAFVEDDGRRYVGISYWTTPEALEASAEVARVARDAAAQLGAVVIGAPIIVREEFDTRAL